MIVRYRTGISLKAMGIHLVFLGTASFIAGLSAIPAHAENANELIKQLQTLQTGDASNKTATQLLKSLHGAADVKLTQVLSAMKGSTPIGRNWLMGLANSLYRKNGAAKEELAAYLADTSNDSESRYLVFHWLTTGDEKLRADMLAKMTDDPSQELRFIAIDNALKNKDLDKSELSTLLEAARHPDQVVSIVEKLKEKGTVVDQSRQFGFLANWRLIGPFDHVGTKNFDKAFPVESDAIAGSLKEEYEGKDGSKVVWKQHTTVAADGAVDLAALFNNEKGCIIYGVSEFESPIEVDAEVRLGCINGNKVWVNGKLVLSNEVYHTNMQIDQYVEPIHLKAGKNQILVKICQNEQKEQWAQLYAFQLRISDSTGKAILAKGR